MKILKLLFSKGLVLVLLFLLQLALIFSAVYFLEYFPIFQLASLVISIIIFLTIVNKKEPPEFKIPWLVLLMIVPFFAIMTYLLFANKKMQKKHYKKLLAIEDRLKPYFPAVDAQMAEILGADAGIEKYLSNTTSLHGYVGSKVQYFKVGEEFWEDLLAELNNAKSYIFMEYFIVHEGKMFDEIHKILVKKAQEGVEVRLMFDDIGSVGAVRRGFCKKLQKEGINCCKFNTFKPIISGIHNNRDHRKITVIDGKIGYTGGVNLGDEYINDINRCGHWKDTAIKIEGAAVNNLLILFLELFEMNAKQQTADFGKYFQSSHKTFEGAGFVHPFGDGPMPFYSEHIGENNYINMINAAKHYCYITTPYLIPDYNLTMALRNAALRGVDVRLITPHIPDKKIILSITRSNYSYLLKAGVKIFEYTPGFVHAKMLVADDNLAFVGTINFDYRSLVHHYECGAVMINTPCIKDIKADFDATLEVSQEITTQNFKMGKLASLFNAILSIFSPML